MGEVDDEAVVLQEISTQNWGFGVRNDKNPAKVTAESKSEGEGTGAVSFDGGVIYCL